MVAASNFNSDKFKNASAVLKINFVKKNKGLDFEDKLSEFLKQLNPYLKDHSCTEVIEDIFHLLSVLPEAKKIGNLLKKTPNQSLKLRIKTIRSFLNQLDSLIALDRTYCISSSDSIFPYINSGFIENSALNLLIQLQKRYSGILTDLLAQSSVKHNGLHIDFTYDSVLILLFLKIDFLCKQSISQPHKISILEPLKNSSRYYNIFEGADVVLNGLYSVNSKRLLINGLFLAGHDSYDEGRLRKFITNFSKKNPDYFLDLTAIASGDSLLPTQSGLFSSTVFHDKIT